MNYSIVKNRIKSMPPFPKSILELLGIISGDYDLSDIVKTIECDGVLSGKIISFSNKAIFAQREEVVSLTKALALLGEKNIVSIAMGCLGSSHLNSDLEGYDAQEDSFWNHSLMVAILSRILAKKSKISINPNFAYTSGLLHDLGKSIISDSVSEILSGEPDDFDQYEIAKKLEESMKNFSFEEGFLELEKKITGFSHTEIGEILAKDWGLPEGFRQVMAFHHCPMESNKEYRNLVFIVHLADYLTMCFGSSTGADQFKYNLDKNYLDYISLAEEDIDKILLQADEELHLLQEN